MKFIVHLPDILPDLDCHSSDISSEAVRKDLEASITDILQDFMPDEVYVERNWDEKQFIFGVEHPGEVISEAANWNKTIEETCLKVIIKGLGLSETSPLPNHLQLNSNSTDQMRRAIMEADDYWNPFGMHGVLLDPMGQGYGPYPVVLLREGWEYKVEQNPEEYAILYIRIR